MQRQRVPTQAMVANEEPSAYQQQELLLTLLILRSHFEEAIAALNCSVEQMTLATCVKVEHALLTIRGVIQMHPIVLDARPSPLFQQLVLLLRSLEDTLLLTISMREQCIIGQLPGDPTGSFWFVREGIVHAVKTYRRLVRLLPTVVIIDTHTHNGSLAEERVSSYSASA